MKIEKSLNYTCQTDAGICATDNTIIEIPTAVKSKKVKLIYYYDALCGWCYGFSPIMSRLLNDYENKIDVDVVSGGLFLGNRAGFVNTVAPHIKAGAYKSVESLTGVKFGTAFLADVYGEGKMILNSLPPTIALCIVREKFPDKELEFAEALLHAVYYDGINPIDILAFGKYAVAVGFDITEFNAKVKDKRYKAMAEEEFLKFRKSKYSGMPSLVLVSDDKEIPITNGYTSYEKLRTRLDRLID